MTAQKKQYKLLYGHPRSNKNVYVKNIRNNFPVTPWRDIGPPQTTLISIVNKELTLESMEKNKMMRLQNRNGSPILMGN